jgi:hypothetical protein
LRLRGSDLKAAFLGRPAQQTRKETLMRVRTIALALFAVFALSAVATSAASAAPEFSKAKDTFTTSSGESVLKGTGLTITCKKDTGSGEVTSKTTVNGTVKFEGCKGEILGNKCPETISSTLVGTLGSVAKAEATSEVGLLFKAKEGAFAEFKCGSLNFKVEGSVAGEVTPTKTLSKTGKVIFALNGSAQKIKEITVEGKKEKPSLKAFGLASTLQSNEENTFAEAIEVA